MKISGLIVGEKAKHKFYFEKQNFNQLNGCGNNAPRIRRYRH
jgi:hypothetical protein